MTATRTAPRHGAADPGDVSPDEPTLVITDPPPPPPRDPAPAPRPAGGSAARRVPGVPAAAGASLALLGVLLVGFGVYLFAFSGVQQAHTQTTLYKTFRNQLGLAVAPTGVTAPGRPVALLDVPGMDLHHSVVVEGTGPGSLTRGPGHRTDTPLPGQPGLSVVYGRRTTFGGPFAHFPRLRQNDVITATTAQGTSRYKVLQFGDSTTPLSQFPTNGLVLVTADSQTFPHHTYSVVAALVGTPFAAAGARPSVPASQHALAIDTSALQPLMMWALLLVIVVTAATLLRQRWARWPTYLCTVPVVLAVLWNVYENAAQLLPNVY